MLGLSVYNRLVVGCVAGRFKTGCPLHFRPSLQTIMTDSKLTAEPNCLFCSIVNEKDPNKILFEDEQVVVFSDIKPAAKCHYLIVTKDHIKDAKVLTKDQKPLVEHMVEVAKKMLQDNSSNPSDASFGFHWPPFTTVKHLHLHAISPASEQGFLSRQIFRPGSWWFVQPDYVLTMLESKV